MSVDIVTAIQNGSFPDSEEVLSSAIDSSSIPPLLESINLAKRDLQQSVRQISREESGDVSSWIDQAKKAQQDIQKCKDDYRHIVQEHSRIEQLRQSRLEARQKTALLQDEISFNETLQKQIHLISDTSAALNKIDADIRQSHFLQAAQALPALDESIQLVSGHQSRLLLAQIQASLNKDLRKTLETTLESRILVTTLQDTISLTIVDHNHTPALSELLDSLDLLGALEDVQTQITKRVGSCVLPHLHKRSKWKITSAVQNPSALHLGLTEHVQSPAHVLVVLRYLLEFVHQTWPLKLREPVLRGLAAQSIPQLIVNWLDPAIPTDLDQLDEIQPLLNDVKAFANWLMGAELREASDLNAWANQIPRTWLSKRRAASLDTVRRAFKLAAGVTRQVERVEKQTVVVDQPSVTDDADDDWADNWDDEEKPPAQKTKQSQDDDEDGSDAWGFDTDDQDSEPSATPNQREKDNSEEDEGDAWGWGDEEDPNAVKPSILPQKKSTSAKANGIQDAGPRREDVTLAEEYTITDIPDYILEQIGKDISDFQTIQAAPQTYFTGSTSPPSGMQTLPTLVLAMFRATSPDYYTTSSSLSRMNLYNDALYLVQKLSQSAPTFTSDIDSLSKFARQTYTSELTLQRTILNDLLDNAQGFTSCTVEPYRTQCESAISSTTDYLRSLHTQWSKILSPSHLSQSIGSLLSGVMSKMIKDIEDMEDIQEAESQKLLQFMDQVSKLEDLFLVHDPSAPATSPEQEMVSSSTIALHAPSYLRFQYLQQILDGSLADIKYLWTDAGLSLEFSAEEVVDLIKALFTESSHRRSAIQLIKSGG